MDQLFYIIIGFAKNCLNEFMKNMAKTMFVPLMHEVNTICRPGRVSKKARELLKAAPCGNAARKGLQKCNINFIDALMGIAREPNDKLKIPMGCW